MSDKLPKREKEKTYKDYLREYKAKHRPTILEAMKDDNPNKWYVLKLFKK